MDVHVCVSSELTSVLVTVYTSVVATVFSATDTVVGRLVMTGAVFMSVRIRSYYQLSVVSFTLYNKVDKLVYH